jgi:hypothetical protein
MIQLAAMRASSLMVTLGVWATVGKPRDRDEGSSDMIKQVNLLLLVPPLPLDRSRTRNYSAVALLVCKM